MRNFKKLNFLYIIYALVLGSIILLCACSKSPEQAVSDTLQKAKAAERAKNYEDARRYYLKALDKAPKNPDALYGLGEYEFS
jgi:hypothetical protein